MQDDKQMNKKASSLDDDVVANNSHYNYESMNDSINRIARHCSRGENARDAYPCTDCSKSFDSKTALFTHMESHVYSYYRCMPQYKTGIGLYDTRSLVPEVERVMELWSYVNLSHLSRDRDHNNECSAGAVSEAEAEAEAEAECLRSGECAGGGGESETVADEGEGRARNVDEGCNKEGDDDDGATTTSANEENEVYYDEDELYFEQLFLVLKTNSNLYNNASKLYDPFSPSKIRRKPPNSNSSSKSSPPDPWTKFVPKRRRTTTYNGANETEIEKWKRKWKCLTCDKPFPSHQALVGHMSSCHPKPEPTTRRSDEESTHQYRCKNCDQGFETNQGLDEHQLSHHVGPSSSSEQLRTQADVREDAAWFDLDLNQTPKDNVNDGGLLLE